MRRGWCVERDFNVCSLGYSLARVYVRNVEIFVNDDDDDDDDVQWFNVHLKADEKPA